MGTEPVITAPLWVFPSDFSSFSLILQQRTPLLLSSHFPGGFAVLYFLRLCGSLNGFGPHKLIGSGLIGVGVVFLEEVCHYGGRL